MEPWKKVSVLLCVFGVIKEFRPTEPYITKYLNNPPMNFTIEQISDEIYPVSIYTAMISLVFVFLLTDFLRYKPVLIFGVINSTLAYILLIFGRSMFAAQLLEVFYGLFVACDVAYYTYIYAKVEKCHYQEVSGYTRAAYLIGRTVSGVVSQLYILLFPTDYFTLNYFTVGGAIIATMWSLFLPSVEFSMYFNRTELNSSVDNLNDEVTPIKGSRPGFRKSSTFMAKDFYNAFSNFYVVKWIFWWSLATAGYYQVLSYVQVLWEQILKDNHSPVDSLNELNGAVETLYTLISAASAYGCGILSVKWSFYGEIILCICSLFLALFLYLMSQTSHILLAFFYYIAYSIIHNGMITIANSEIAKNINPDSHGLIFGFTMFLALVLQSLLTVIVSSILTLDERTKFVIYGLYFTFLGIVFAVTTILKKLRVLYFKSPKTDIVIQND